MLLETEDLRIYERIVATSSISRAAAELRVPRATVSRKLALLEERLGVRLVQRTTRRMAVTAPGRELHRHALLVLDAVRSAEASVRREEGGPRGVVRLSMPPMGSGALGDVLADFVRAHPGVRLETHVSSRLVDLAAEGFDAAIRATGKLAPGLVARRLAKVRLVAVASPAYLAEHGTPATLADLGAHRCLLGLDGETRPLRHWKTTGRPVALEGAAFANDAHLLFRFALRGLGIAMVPSTLAAAAIARGELAPVLPAVLRVEGGVALVSLESRLLGPAARALVDWLVARAPAALAAPATR